MIDSTGQPAHTPQVLIVDDTPANLKLLTDILMNHGYRVRPASSGRLALRSVAVEPPDLILLDVKMPDMDGYEVCRRLKSDDQTRSIPVIFVSALDEAADKIKGFHAGGVDYITKPYESTEVLARVETHLALRSLQKQLEAQNIQLRMLLSTAATAIFTLGLDGNVNMVNDEFCFITGFEKEEVEGRHYSILGETTYLDTLDLQGADLATSIQRRESSIQTKDGRTLSVLMNHTPVTDDRGAVTGFIVSFVDVTETIEAREAAEKASRALKDSEERMRRLIDRSPLGIGIISNGTYVYSNPALTSFFGLNSPDELIGRPMIESIDPADHELVIRSQEDILAGNTLLNSGEVKRIGSDGKRLDMNLWQTKIDLSEGPAIVVFAADTSEDKILRAQLLQAQKMEAIATLVGGIAHEFNNLLTIVSGYTQVILADKDESDLDYSDLQKIVYACQRGADLVNRLGTFGRETEIRRIPVRINEEVEQARELLLQTIPKMIDIELKLASDVKTVNADPGKIAQVLVNLALNAKDAMPEGGKLTFETRNTCVNGDQCEKYPGAKPGDYVQLIVSDTGVGISAEVLDHIFEPFFTTRGLAERSGLGLAVVYAIVEAHGGHITCQSRVGEGTTFRIYFPAVAQEGTREQSIQEGEQIGKEAILLVDDEAYIRHLGERILGRAGYEVLTASTGEDALTIYSEERERISLVILDLIMPGMGGKKCLMELFEMNPGVKVLISSGTSPDEDSKEFFETHTRGLVAKPYDMKQLLQTVRDALDK